MEAPDIKASRDQILRAAKIKKLAPQKLVKECLSDVGFSPFLTTHATMVMRFKRTLANLDEDTPGKTSKVARRGVPGMVAVGGASLVESLSSPSFATSSSKKTASSVSTKPASSSKKPAVAIRRSSSQVHKTMEATAKECANENNAYSAATRLLAAQKEKPESERLVSTKVAEMINEQFKANVNPATTLLGKSRRCAFDPKLSSKLSSLT
jgi:hypothetical protein